MSRRRPLLGLFALAGFLAGCSLAGDVTPPPGAEVAPALPQATAQPISAPATRPSAAAGAQLYAENCTRCHGPQGAGDGEFSAQIDAPMPDFTDGQLASSRTPREWFEIITNGRMENLMPPWAEALTASERWDLVAYLYTLSAPASDLEAGGEIYALQCAACHGSRGQGDGPEAASLPASLADFTDGEFMIDRSNVDFVRAVRDGVGAGMPAFGDTLTAAEIQATVEYVRSLWYEAPEAPPAEAAAPAPGAETAAAEGAVGRVFGTLRNSTSGEPAPGGIAVTLHLFDNFAIVDTLSAETAGDGSFAFGDVPLVAGRSLVVTAEYDSVLYNSDVLVVEQGVAEYQADVRVFESTTDPTVVQFKQFHVIVQDAASSLQITEVIVFANSSDRTLAAPANGGATLEVALPEGASDLQFDNNVAGGMEATASGFALTRPVFPGAEPSQLVFSFLLPYDGELAFDQTVMHPTSATNVVLPHGGMRLAGAGFTNLGERQISSDLSIVAYSGPPLSPGDALRFSLSGYSESTGILSDIVPGNVRNLLLGASALVLALIGLAWWWLLQRPKTLVDGAPAHVTQQLTGEEAEARRDWLLDAISGLDEAYEAGEASGAEYRRQRQALKRELVELVTRHDLEV